MKRRGIILLLLMLSVAAGAMPVDVNIPETIRGVSQYANYSVNVDARPQRFIMDWENQGSPAVSG